MRNLSAFVFSLVCLCCNLELEVHSEADTVLLQFVASINVGHIVVIETANILNRDDLEDIADADGEFHVGLLAHHERGRMIVSCWKDKEIIVFCLHEGVIFVGQVSV